MNYWINKDIPNTWVGIGVVLGKCEGDERGLESVIRSLDPEVKVEYFANGLVAYNFNSFGSAKAIEPGQTLSNGAFKATVFDYRNAGISCNGFNVGIAVTSDSLALLKEVIDTIIRQAQVEVISYHPNVLNLNFGSGNGAPASPSAHYSSPGVFLN